jgi:TP901 family phage tail tape measure protein
MQTGVSNQEMAQGYYDLQSALGVYGDDATKIATLVGNYSVATQAEFADSINQTTKAMKAFGIGSDGVQALLESNAKTVQVGIVSFAELAKVQTEYAGAASAAGQNVDTANKIFAAFTSIAKGADQAANMTKTAFQGLSDPKVLGQLEAYGVTIYDATGKMRNMDDIISETSANIGKMNDQKFNKFMGDVGGPEGLRALFGKLRTGADDFFSTMNAYNNTKYDLNMALENAKQDPAALKKIVGNQWDTIMTTIGLKFLPLVANILQPISTFLTKIFSYLDGSTKISQQWAPALSIVGDMFSSIWDSITNIWHNISGIIQSITVFISNSELLSDIFAGIGFVLKTIFDIAWAGVSAIGETLKQVWGNIIMPILNGIEQAYRWVKELVTGKKVQVTTVHKQLNPTKPDNPIGSPIGNPIPTGSGGDGTVTSHKASADAKTVGSGSQTKNITINIDSFIKGFTPQHQAVNGMNRDELERWLTEMFLRVTRSAEMAQ